MVNLIINKDKESRIELLERNLQLKEQMKKDFLKDSYFEECYKCDISELLSRPTDKFVEKEILICDIEDDTYPERPPKKGISPYFKLAPKDFYHNGFCFMNYQQRVVRDKYGNWTLSWKDTPKGFTSFDVNPLLYIPFSNIVNYDLDRNEYDDGPIIFCKFEGLSGGPYEKIEYQPIRSSNWHVLPNGKRFKDSYFGWSVVRIKQLIENLKIRMNFKRKSEKNEHSINNF